MTKAWEVPPARGRFQSVALDIDRAGCGTWGGSVPLASFTGAQEGGPRLPLLGPCGPAFFGGLRPGAAVRSTINPCSPREVRHDQAVAPDRGPVGAQHRRAAGQVHLRGPGTPRQPETDRRLRD